MVKLMKAAKGTVAALKAKQTALTNLKKSLMHDLVTGKVRAAHLDSGRVLQT